MATDDHGQPADDQPLTDPERRAPTHAERARTLAAGLKTGTLSTLTQDGFPYGSYVTFALDGADPVFLVSRLAAHTQNLSRDTRASLLVHASGADDPLANGRITLVGACTPVADSAAAREAFLEAHPGASYYVDFKDFGFHRLAVAKVRYIGGYGRMSWVDVEAWRSAEPDPLLKAASGVIEHMNADHADAVIDYARAFTRATTAEAATMTSIDRYGFDMSVITEQGPRPARVAFDTPISRSEDARLVLVGLVKTARQLLETRDS